MAGSLTIDAVRELFYSHKEEILNYFVYPYLVLSISVFLICRSFKVFNRQSLSSEFPQKILLITAHPDDECMFTSPLLLSLCNSGHFVYVLCLTTGNYYGLGELRQAELRKSCGELGVPGEHVLVEDNGEIQDDPKVTWDKKVVSERIVAIVYKLQPHAIISFDSYGVSGHKNHIALYVSLSSLCHEGLLPQNTKVFCLESVSILRKYLSILDLPLTYLLSTNIYMSSPWGVLKSWRAMYSHRSQFVWFRILYILFSRYMLVNSLKQICHRGDC